MEHLFKTLRNAIYLSCCALLIVSCSKEEGQVDLHEDQKANVEVKDDLLSFKTFEDYDKALSERGEFVARFSSFNSISKNLSKETTANQKRQEDIPADYEDYGILDLLNEDGMIKIGEFTFKLDFVKEVVAAVSGEDETVLELLKNEDYQNEGIMLFSFNDDVLTLLEEGSSGTITKRELESGRYKDGETDIANKMNDFCSISGPVLTESAWDKKTVQERVECTDASGNCKFWLADAKHTYQATGIYYSLQSKIKYRGDVPCANNAPYARNTYLYYSVFYEYERRRRFQSPEYESGTASDFNNSANEISYRAYEGSRSLESFTLNTTYRYDRADYCLSYVSCEGDPTNAVRRTITMPTISKN